MKDAYLIVCLTALFRGALGAICDVGYGLNGTAEYFTKTSGKCEFPITTADECQKATTRK